jgi:hypothetical protein
MGDAGWPGGRLVVLLRALPPCPDHRHSRILFAIFLFALLLLSLLPRVQQYQTWLEKPSDHWVGEISVSSPDSYYWLRLAREIRESFEKVNCRVRRRPPCAP